MSIQGILLWQFKVFIYAHWPLPFFLLPLFVRAKACCPVTLFLVGGFYRSLSFDLSHRSGSFDGSVHSAEGASLSQMAVIFLRSLIQIQLKGLPLFPLFHSRTTQSTCMLVTFSFGFFPFRSVVHHCCWTKPWDVVAFWPVSGISEFIFHVCSLSFFLHSWFVLLRSSEYTPEIVRTAMSNGFHSVCPSFCSSGGLSAFLRPFSRFGFHCTSAPSFVDSFRISCFVVFCFRYKEDNWSWSHGKSIKFDGKILVAQ